jgi:hypothetical protein
VENFEAYFKKQQADSNCGFAEEYEVGGFRYCVFHCFMVLFYGEPLGEEVAILERTEELGPVPSDEAQRKPPF